MTDTEIIIEITKLDDIMYEWCEGLQQNAYYSILQKIWYPSQRDIPYLTSRDAIVPVIERQVDDIKIKIGKSLYADLGKTIRHSMSFANAMKLLFSTPRQLCIALLKATGKWKE